MATETLIAETEKYLKQAAPEVSEYFPVRLKYLASVLAALRGLRSQEPVDMVLFCPACCFPHIDWPEYGKDDSGAQVVVWANPPHKSHLCHQCKHIWRPANVPTNGVATVQPGTHDSPLASPPAAHLSAQRTGRAEVPISPGKVWGPNEHLLTEHPVGWFDSFGRLVRLEPTQDGGYISAGQAIPDSWTPVYAGKSVNAAKGNLTCHASSGQVRSEHEATAAWNRRVELPKDGQAEGAKINEICDGLLQYAPTAFAEGIEILRSAAMRSSPPVGQPEVAYPDTPAKIAERLARRAAEGQNAAGPKIWKPGDYVGAQSVIPAPTAQNAAKDEAGGKYGDPIPGAPVIPKHWAGSASRQVDANEKYLRAKANHPNKAREFPVDEDSFAKNLAQLLNSVSKENGSDTPDWILAEFLRDSLKSLDSAGNKRSQWYGGKPLSAHLAAQPVAAEGFVVVPVEPTEEMLNAARDWSAAKFGKPVGNDGAKGCWHSMLTARPKRAEGEE